MKKTGNQGPLHSDERAIINIFDAEAKRERERTMKTADCIAQINMMLYYAKGQELDRIIEALLNMTHALVGQYVDKKKEQDFKAGKNPFLKEDW